MKGGLNKQKMNAIKVLAILMLGILLIMPSVLADNETDLNQSVPIDNDTVIEDNVTVENDTDLPEPGIGPESKLYGWENRWDKWRLRFTFNKEKRFQKAIEIAEERLAEAQATNDSEAAERAQERYDYFIDKAEEALEKMEGKKGDKLEKALAQTVRSQERIEAHKEKVSAVHNRILERLRANENLTDEELAHLEEVFGRIEDRAERAQNKVGQRQEVLRARYKFLNNASDEEINKTIEELREEHQERIQEKLEKRQRNSQDDDDDENESEDELEDEEENDESEDNETSQGNQTQAGQQ